MHLSPPFPANGFKPAAVIPGGFLSSKDGALHIDTSGLSMHHRVKIQTSELGTREDRETRIGIDSGFFLWALEK
jgi:hypothetical protein